MRLTIAAEEATALSLKLRLLTDAEITALGDIERPRGPVEFFLLQRPNGTLQVVLIADGLPVVTYEKAPTTVTF